MIPQGTGEFTVDPQKAQMGQRMFGMLGCAACHTSNGVPQARQSKPLAQLSVDAADGCLGTTLRKAVPQYNLSDAQVAALKAAIISAQKNAVAFETALPVKEQVTRTVAAMNCYACHRRDDVGGPAGPRADLFVMSGNFDMGDEGRIPPKLTGVGAKILPDALGKIIFEGALHIRPYLATRMPRFSKDVIGGLPASFAAADMAGEDAYPAFTEAAARDGRLLVGTKGLGCVNCHGVAGVKSLGMPAPDLSSVHDRLRPGWFHGLLVEPTRYNPATRMPAFWPEGRVALPEIAKGTITGQIDAIWNYLSLGKSIPLPIGLQPTNGYELTPIDEPIIHRTFMADVGSRAVLVGFPERLNIAFDANGVRLAKAWEGRFFDAGGQWEGRGGKALARSGPTSSTFRPAPRWPSWRRPTPNGRPSRQKNAMSAACGTGMSWTPRTARSSTTP